MSVPAATALALWGAAAGGAPADDVITALQWHGVTAGVRRDGTVTSGPAAGLPGPGEAPVGTAALLPLLRPEAPFLVLPREGDVRGLPARPTALTVAALTARAAVVLPGAGLTVVPVDGVWRVYEGAGTVEHLDQVAVREHLDDAVVEATRIFTSADLGRQAGADRGRVAALVHELTVEVPPGTPARATALLDRAVHLEAILTVASGDRSAAVTAREWETVDRALAPLSDAARRARQLAVQLTVRHLRPVSAAGSSRPERLSPRPRPR